MKKQANTNSTLLNFTYGINGSIGTKSPDEFFRSTFTEYLLLCACTAKTINEIADDLGVSLCTLKLRWNF